METFIRSAVLGVVLGLLSPGAAFAAEEGMGRVTVLGGWRLTPNNHFEASAVAAGTPLVSRSPGGPALIAGFGYSATALIEVAIDAIVGAERLHLTGSAPFTSLTYGALLNLRLQPQFTADFGMSVGVGTGPVLVDILNSHFKVASERLTEGWEGEIGLFYRLSPRYSLTLEYRLLLARGTVNGVGSVNAGGSWLGLGFTFWLSGSDRTQISDFR